MTYNPWAIIVACGKEQQFSADVAVPFLSMAGRPIITYVLTAYEQSPDVKGVVVVTDKLHVATTLGMVQMYGLAKVRNVIPGFASRQASVMAALRSLDDEVNLVIIDEGNRPFVKPELIAEVIKTAKRYGSAVAARPAPGPVKMGKKGQLVVKGADGAMYWIAEYPQAFRRDLLEKGLEAANRQKRVLADESAALDLIRAEVRVVENPSLGFAVRSPSDFSAAMALLKP